MGKEKSESNEEVKACALQNVTGLVPDLAAAELTLLKDGVLEGTVDRSALMSGCLLSKEKVLANVLKFGFRSDSSLMSNPATYTAYRSLKFAVERIAVSPEEIEVTFSVLIDEIREYRQHHPEVETVSALSKQDAKLYRRLRDDPHARLIGWAAGFPRERRDFLYWSDQQILEAAACYGSLSSLKRLGGELHRHVLGRALKNRLLTLNPQLVGNFRVGHGGHRYRSLPELVLGNWLELNHIPVMREVELGVYLDGSNKSLVADFKLINSNLVVELLQSKDNGRGSRGIEYDLHWAEKEIAYQGAGIRFVSITTDQFFDHGVFLVAAFVEQVQVQMKSFDAFIGTPPPSKGLLFENCEIKSSLLNVDTSAVIEYLHRLGATNTAKLKNNFSWAMTCLQARDDFESIITAFRVAGNQARGAASAARFAANRRRYAPIEEVRLFCKEFQIKSQSQWFAFCRSNKDLLKSRHIPTNLPQVYEKLGTWSDWYDLYTPMGHSAKVGSEVALSA